MSTHKIVPYEIRLKRRNGWAYNLNDENFDNIPGIRDYGGFEDFVGEFLNSHLGSSETDETRQKTFSIKEYHRSEKAVIGRLRTGEWGWEEDKYNVENDSREESARDVKDSMELDFFFMIVRSENLPDESAVLILEQFKGKGSKTELERQLSDFIDTQEVRLEINRLFTKDIVRELRQAENLLRFKLETEKGPQLDLDYDDLNNDEIMNGERREEDNDETTRQKIEIKPEPGGRFFSLESLTEKISSNEDIGFSRSYNFEILDIDAVVSKAGSERTVSLDEGDAVKMVDIMDPSETDVRTSKGRVQDGSLAKYSSSLVSDLEDSYQSGKITNF